MKANKKKLELAMARACLSLTDLVDATTMPEPTVKNVLAGRSVRPATFGRIAKALNVDPEELLEMEAIPQQGGPNA
ncbi:MAG: helix-turn-helix transcriptional regulator [Treponema sp.]|jgi:DNA-binding Xre family transcriptional regulator|nr:helix-turn-helix transcriptional regulator [Treponema sp.]